MSEAREDTIDIILAMSLLLRRLAGDLMKGEADDERTGCVVERTERR